MTDHLPILQVLVPLSAAPLCVLLRHRAAALTFAVAAAWATFGIAALLLARVLEVGLVTYALGGWAAPWGIEYRLDALGAFMLLIVSGLGAVVLSAAPRSVAREIRGEQHYLFCASYLLALAGLLGICITGDLFNLFVFLEISSLSSYALISLGAGQSRQALWAAFQYLVMGTIGATFILIGIGLMYMMTGTLNMEDAAARLGQVTGRRTVLVAFAFLSVGISLKIALFPLHAWLPGAYTHAPSIVTAFLAATATKVSVYILLRFVFTIFRRGFTLQTLEFDMGLMVLSLAGIVVASTAAIYQPNVKRMLAYSSVAQIGYMVLGISFASVTGMTAGIVHVFNHALIKGGLFLVMACVALRAGSVTVEGMKGLGRRMPLTMAAFVVGGLNLIGVPLTAGFITKWYLILAALERGLWPVALLTLFSSLLAVVYVWRVVEAAYFQPPARAPGGEAAQAGEAPMSMLAPAWLLLGATLVFGVYTNLPVGVAGKAARVLLGVEP